MSKPEHRRRPRPGPSELASEIAKLETLDAAALRQLWPRHFGRPPPGWMQRRTLALALAHRIQCEALGGLTRTAARFLDQIAAREFGEAAARASKPRRIRVGTTLVREWHGIVHEVAVVEDGFAWNGVRHKSLSAVARAITGTRWNGPAFFGLKDTARRGAP